MKLLANLFIERKYQVTIPFPKEYERNQGAFEIEVIGKDLEDALITVGAWFNKQKPLKIRFLGWNLFTNRGKRRVLSSKIIINKDSK